MKGDRISKTNSFSNKLYKELKNISEKTRIPISRLLDEGIEYLISKYKNN